MAREFTDTDPELVQKTYEESRFDRGQTTRERDDLKAALEGIYREAKSSDGKSVDLMHVSEVKLSGGPFERYAKVCEIHSKLAGKNKMLEKIRQMEIGSKEVLEGPEPEEQKQEAMYAKGTNAPYVQPNIADVITRRLRADGYHGKRMWSDAARAKRNVEFDWGSAVPDLRATALKITGTDVVQPQRLEGIVPAISNPVRLLDALPVQTTSSSSVEYLSQSTRTLDIKGKAEGSPLEDTTFVFTKASTAVEKIGSFIPVTDEMLEDEPSMRSFVVNDLMLGLRQTVDAQVKSGAGTSNTIKGIITYAPDSGNETKVIAGNNNAVKTNIGAVIDDMWELQRRVTLKGRATPSFYAIDSDLWTTMVTIKNTNGDYLKPGGPFTSLQPILWGLPVIQLDDIAATVNTISGFCASTDYIRLLVRREGSVEFGYQATDFIDGQQTVRISGRFGLMLQRLKSVAFLKRPSS